MVLIGSCFTELVDFKLLSSLSMYDICVGCEGSIGPLTILTRHSSHYYYCIIVMFLHLGGNRTVALHFSRKVHAAWTAHRILVLLRRRRRVLLELARRAGYYY